MEIQKKNIIAAYESADEKGKEMLKALFPDLTFNEKDDRPITERIKTFEDACNELGDDNQFVQEYNSIIVNTDVDICYDIISFLKLRIVCAALNEGWMPKFTEDESRWYPWHWLYTQEEIDRMEAKKKKERCMMQTTDYVTEYAGFACAGSNYAPSNARAYFGSRLCLKNSELATYCGMQFIDLWADFKLTRK